MTEAQIQRQILDWLTAEHIFAFRINTAAFKAEGRFFRSHSLGAGAADILALCNGPSMTWMPHWIECKTAKGRQSSEQKSFQEYVESLGHQYLICHSVDDLAGLGAGVGTRQEPS